MGLFGKNRDLTASPDRVELRVDASAMRSKRDELVVRLDQFLAHHLKWRSRSSVQHLVKDGYVFVDASSPEAPEGTGELKEERRSGRKLRAGSRVVVMIPEALQIQPVDLEADPVDILYEDDEVVAIDKPANLAVHPSGRHLSNTLIQRVHAHYREDVEAGRMVPRLCHRLDRETSGIVLIAKHPETHPLVTQQFEDREVEKEYLAIVRGHPAEGSGRIELAMAPSRTSSVRLKMAIASDGLEARTDWRVLERLEGHSLITCRLHTGRQHQIRLHLASIGHPIVGDKLYIDEEIFQRSAEGELEEADLHALGMPRHALHNHRLVFESPVSRRRVAVVSELPDDMSDFAARHSGE